jgi:hydrogenase/urease accessory protein HupE
VGLVHLRAAREAVNRPVAVAFVVVAAWFAAQPAAAHQEPYSFLDVRLDDGGMHGRLIAHIVDLAHEASLPRPDSLLSPGYATAHREALERVLADHLRLFADDARVTPEWTGMTVVPERRSLAFDWRVAAARPPGSVRLAAPLFPYDPPHETYFNVYERGVLAKQDLVDRSHPESRFLGRRQELGSVVRSFVLQGIHHIFIGPDHILFVVGLLLLGGSIRRLLKIVTAFTLAHSVTLALATLRIVNPPSRLVEPMIALSIVAVGIETLVALERRRDLRAPIAFAFGFVHGFGFASVLREFGLPPGALGWSLASFNVGVEIGQAVIVLTVAPLLAFSRTRGPAVARGVVTAGSALIIAAGGYWFVKRVFFAV